MSLDASFGGGYGIGAIIFLEETQSPRYELSADMVTALGIGRTKAFAFFRGLDVVTNISAGGSLMLYQVVTQGGS